VEFLAWYLDVYLSTILTVSVLFTQSTAPMSSSCPLFTITVPI